MNATNATQQKNQIKKETGTNEKQQKRVRQELRKLSDKVDRLERMLTTLLERTDPGSPIKMGGDDEEEGEHDPNNS